MSLADKIRKSRQFRCELNGYTFICRRPTIVEWADMAGPGSSGRLLPFVIGWENVKQSDVVPAGDPIPMAFDAEACAEWLADRSDLFGPIIKAINEAMTAHILKMGADEKN